MFSRAMVSGLGAMIVATGATLIAMAPAQALTMQECSAKYQAAQTAGTLNGMKWNDFRKAQCGADATPAAATPAAAAPAATPAAAPAAPAARTAATPAPAPAAAARAAPAPAATGNVVFPTTVSSKYANESPGRARMHTCLDQYNANKATNANGGLRWVQSGGGYYSQCNTKLKG